MAILCDFFAYFGKKMVATATSLDPCKQKTSYLDWSTPKTIPHITRHFVTNCYTCDVS